MIWVKGKTTRGVKRDLKGDWWLPPQPLVRPELRLAQRCLLLLALVQFLQPLVQQLGWRWLVSFLAAELLVPSALGARRIQPRIQHHLHPLRYPVLICH
mmetsp:Transcript_11784/g.21462  ORF Transcript_11784/g.21462 Transcript_11784/m.21462 type:complete len:99 (-) Transcript_11784:514-810(-)